ncbi:hypothetical protein SLEP1_g11109 [Rubroshorea leprosula]|uniref:Uncharacterized protein n=2 Tax=Rubroshorea leprosula TaxID=152421 RepID=A0AAV5IIR1_9ROSI|nr:hypothetical protein SLEP1_g11109 [Rubroshorea leprosula]
MNWEANLFVLLWCSNGIRTGGQEHLLFWVKQSAGFSKSKKPIQVGCIKISIAKKIVFYVLIFLKNSLDYGFFFLWFSTCFSVTVLSDHRKRILYDAGLYDPEDEEDEEFCDFVNEMMSMMAQTRKEEKYYSMEELQRMFMEMAQGFDMASWLPIENSGRSQMMQCNSIPMVDWQSHLGASEFEVYRTSSSYS